MITGVVGDLRVPLLSRLLNPDKVLGLCYLLSYPSKLQGGTPAPQMSRLERMCHCMPVPQYGGRDAANEVCVQDPFWRKGRQRPRASQSCRAKGGVDPGLGRRGECWPGVLSAYLRASFAWCDPALGRHSLSLDSFWPQQNLLGCRVSTSPLEHGPFAAAHDARACTPAAQAAASGCLCLQAGNGLCRPAIRSVAADVLVRLEVCSTYRAHLGLRLHGCRSSAYRQ